MVSLHVFVSFITTNVSRQEAELGQQLINDLRHVGAEVVTDDESVPDAQFMQFLQQELAHCQWLILIQTAEAARSLRVQVTMNTAQQQVAQGSMQGMLRIVCPSSEEASDVDRYIEAMAFPYSGDYPRIRDKVLLALDLLLVDDIIEKNLYKAPTMSLPDEANNPVPAQMPVSTRKDVPLSMRGAERLPLTLAKQEASQEKQLTEVSGGSRMIQGDRPVVPQGFMRKTLLFRLLFFFFLLLTIFVIIMDHASPLLVALFVLVIGPAIVLSYREVKKQ
jgi:hypothetical protein